MAADNHQQQSLKMVCTGMILSLANDLQVKGKFNFLKNVRIITDGILESRAKVDSFLTLNYAPDATPGSPEIPHTLKTILNKDTATFNRIAGIGTRIFTGASSPLLNKDTGYSSNPISIVDFRPDESIESYAYIADKNKMSKISVSNILDSIGLKTPTKALTFKISTPNDKILDNITAGDIGDWNNLTGSAGVPTSVTRVDTTITAILYDGANPNYASIVPAALTSSLQAGAILTLNGVEDIIVKDVIPSPILAGVATIASIVYDAGATGLCTIVLSVSNEDIKRNSILFLNATEYVKVIEVTRDVNNIPSIRCSTIGTLANGNSVTGAPSFRAFVNGNFAATQTIKADALKSIIGTNGISSITKIFNVDLTNTGTAPLTEDAILHLSLQADPALVTEIQIQLDCDSVNNDFTRNYFYYVVTPNFLVSSTSQSSSTLSTLQQATQRTDLLNNYRLQEKLAQLNPDYQYQFEPIFPTFSDTLPIEETALGANQWTELFIRIGNLLRSGSDTSRTVKDIKAIRISVNCTAGTNLLLDSIWVGNATNLDSDPSNSGVQPYNYIWRVRNKSNGNKSNWSPPIREGVDIFRESLILTPDPTGYDATLAIDIARFGGSLNDYRIIGTIKADGSSFIDNISDRTAAVLDSAGRLSNQIGSEIIFDFYQPFTFLDTPKSGTCNIVGTKFTKISGDNLNISWPRGVQVLINGKLNQLYTNPSSTTQVELEKDMGNLTGVPFEIKSPLLTGQPLPTIFGPFGEGNSGLVIFGIGNQKAAGTLYWLDGNFPDTQSDLNFLEITSPSEPILAGVMYDGYAFIFTNKRSFYLMSTFQSGTFGFTARESNGSRGVFSPYSICSGKDYIYFLSENGDGIYRVAGNGVPECLTNESLYNLFIHNGVFPSSITLIPNPIFTSDGTIVNPPDFTKPNELRLFDSNEYIFFRFIDTTNKQACLVFDKRIKDWISYDTYLNDSVNVFYQEEIQSTSKLLVGIDGAIGIFNSATSREDSIDSTVLPFFSDFGDSNLLKQLDEIVIDADQGIGGLSYYIFRDSGIGLNFIAIPGDVNHKRQKFVKTIGTANTNIKNIVTRYTWKLNSLVKLYEQQYYYIPREDKIFDRPSDVSNSNLMQDKWYQGIIITADTNGKDKTLKFLNDAGILKSTIIINTTGKQTLSRSFPIPFISHSITRISDDGIDWIFYDEEYKFDVEPELGTVWQPQETSFGIPGFKVIQRIGFPIRSTSDGILRITYDGFEEIYPLSDTKGRKKKQYFFLQARKGILIGLRVEADKPLRVYENDFEFWIRQYNSELDYQIIKPFGDRDFVQGAKI